MKRKLLSLLLSAVMLFTLVTPAFADEEQLPNEAAVEEETVGEEAGEETVVEDEGGEETADEVGEVTLFENPASSGGGSYYSVDDNGVATFTRYDGFCAAMDDDDVKTVLIEEGHDVIFSGFDETIYITKPLTINGTLRIENTYVLAVADVTVNGRLEIYGDFPDHYTEWHMAAPDNYWENHEGVPTELDGPKLINNGEIEMSGLSGIMLSWPCDYEEGEDAELSGGEFKYADYLNYKGNSDDSGLTACYTEEQMKIETQYYDDDGNPMGEPVVLRTAYVNTEMGLKAALASTVYNSSIQVFGDEPVTLSKADNETGEYNAPCTLMTNVSFTVGEGVTLNLADGAFNQFNNGLTVEGTLNVNTNGNMCFVNGDTQIVPGGTLMNKNGSNLCFDGDVTVAGEEDDKHGELYNSFGFMQFFGQTQINGFFLNQGKAENCGEMTVSGHLRIEDSDAPITYEENREEASDHALFNRNFIKVEQGGMLTVGGYLQNDGGVEVCGEMQVCATAQDNNKSPDTDGYGVLNGAVQSFGDLDVNGGTLTVKGAEDEKPFGGALVSHGRLNIHENGRVIADGQLWTVGEVWIGDNEADQEAPNLEIGGVFYNYSNMNLDGGLMSIEGEAYNEDGSIDLNGGELKLFGYLRNNGRLQLSGGILEVLPASEPNCGDDPAEFNDRCSVLCNNGEVNLEEGAELWVDGAEVDGYYNALVRNNGAVRVNGGEDGGAKLALGGTLVNDGNVENRGSFTVSGTAARIENHRCLKVGDSKTYQFEDGNSDFNPIDWKDGASAETVIIDDEQLRMARQCSEGEDTWYELQDGLFDIQGAQWHGLFVMQGREFSGEWNRAEDARAGVQNYEDDDDSADHVTVIGNNDYGYSVFFNDWGETQLVLLQTVEDDDTWTCVYPAGTGLHDGGFYTSCDVFDGEGWNVDKAQNASVYGNRVLNEGGATELWYMRDRGFDEGEINGCSAWINGQEANIEPGEDDWYLVRIDETEYLKLRRAQRYDGRFDVECRFNDEIDFNFDLGLRVGDTECHVECIRPIVYVENIAGVKGGDVTVVVRAENMPAFSGYQLQLAYDAQKLTAKGISVNGDYSAVTDVNNDNGTVRVVVATTEENEINNGDLFYVTFTVANTDAVGACEDIAVRFDNGYPQKLATVTYEETELAAALRGGNVQTFIAGDVHRDGEVDILDAVRLLRAAAELVELGPAEREAARVVENDDNLITGVVPILNYLAKDTPLTYYPAQ